MDDRYEAFAMADPVFYDALHSERTAGASFPTAARPLPDGWHRGEQDDWLVFGCHTTELPAQGWKIHVSACPHNAERILDAVWDYCVPRGIDFKFLRSPAALTARVSKYAPRGYSGKLVTIYPADDSACETILRELGEALDGEPSPYILSDLRWGSGPLYVRYGAFLNQYVVDDRGEVVPAIANADGTLVPDRRDPVFYVPPWVTLPDFLGPHFAARNSVTVAGLPYTIERVVHFSNGGGIYVGRDTRTGERVVLKEGRPHAGLDGHGHDAVRRLEREHDVMRRLAGIPGIPKVYDLFWLGEHRFLAMEFIDGEVLSRSIVLRYPLTDPTAGPGDIARYADWAVGIHRQVEATLAAVHERGLVYGDLHLFNVMVRDDGTIALLDFEVAADVAEASRPGLGNQGFAAPRTLTGFDIDRYALACLRLALFLPMTNLLWLHRPKAVQYAEIIAEHFGVPDEFLAPAVEVIAPAQELARATARGPARATAPAYPSIEPDPDAWPRLRDDLVRSIVASATPDRDDRLFPGDPQQFAVGGLGLAYGAAGVLYALSVTGGGRQPRLERWLARRATNPPGGTRPGLYDGLHGAAFALDHLGHRQEALDTVDICLREHWESLGPDLAGGLAGVGLNLLHLADRTGEPALRLAARRAAALVAERLAAPDTGPEISDERARTGLLRGWSGAALLLLRAYDDSGDPGLLGCAAEALRRDLRRCVTRENGTVEVNEGWRTMPYLGAGSAGIGLVLDEYLARRHDDQFATALRGIELACESTMYILPGLFTGRAGILLYLAGRSTSPATDPLVARQVRGLAWHALPYAGGVAFPGNGLLRLSMDLATGTAGVLLALGAALHREPVHAPLLAPTRRLTGPISPMPAGPGPTTPRPAGPGQARPGQASLRPAGPGPTGPRPAVSTPPPAAVPQTPAPTGAGQVSRTP
ncbi:MAG TPA: class III lanthionine synthetase LanKC [Pilimelia sp.]|nr:class III lanthionine synthetase LanKC [Pilimelia sp.]